MAAILVGILAVLAVLVVVTTPRADEPVAGQVVRLIDVPASQIGEIVVADGGREVRVGRDAAWNGWLVRESRDQTQISAWPASESTVSAGVRVLANAKATLGRKHHLHRNEIVWINNQAGEMICTLYIFRHDVLGGRVPAILIPQRYGTIERALASFLSPDSLLGWRDTMLLPGLDAGVVGLSVERSDETLSLRRVGSAWALESPVREPADASAVQGLIEKLISARSERFVNEIPGEGGVKVEVESGAAGDRRRYSARLDASGALCEVTLEATREGELVEVARATHAVSGDVALALGVDVTDLVSKRSVATPASEVAGLTLGWTGREVQRTSAGWASPEDEATASAWLGVLTLRDSDDVSLVTPEAPEIGTLTLKGFGDLAMGAYRVRADGEMVWIARESVWRGYRVDNEARLALGLQ